MLYLKQFPRFFDWVFSVAQLIVYPRPALIFHSPLLLHLPILLAEVLHFDEIQLILDNIIMASLGKAASTVARTCGLSFCLCESDDVRGLSASVIFHC